MSVWLMAGRTRVLHTPRNRAAIEASCGTRYASECDTPELSSTNLESPCAHMESTALQLQDIKMSRATPAMTNRLFIQEFTTSMRNPGVKDIPFCKRKSALLLQTRKPDVRAHHSRTSPARITGGDVVTPAPYCGWWIDRKTHSPPWTVHRSRGIRTKRGPVADNTGFVAGRSPLCTILQAPSRTARSHRAGWTERPAWSTSSTTENGWRMLSHSELA